MSEDLKTIKLDYNKMASKLADAKKNLEDETLKRIDLGGHLVWFSAYVILRILPDKLGGRAM